MKGDGGVEDWQHKRTGVEKGDFVEEFLLVGWRGGDI